MLVGIITKVAQATAKTGSSYVTLNIKTKEGDVALNVWGAESKHFDLWKLATVTAEKRNDQGVSCILSQIKVTEPTQEYLDMVPHCMSDVDWMSLVGLVVEGMTEKQAKFFTEQARAVYIPYSKMPAAKSNHHVYPGGLLEHTAQLLQMYVALRNVLPFKTNRFIVSISCLFHDYIKLAEYDSKTYDYQPIMFLKGHVFGSAEVLGALMRKEGFDSEIILHCQHCILAHHGKPEWGSLIPATPEAFLVHHLDMLSGHGTMYGETPTNTKSFGLGTTIFHYEGQE